MSLQRRFACALKALGVCLDVPAAIALSGGPDSLALAILASDWLCRDYSGAHNSRQAPRWTAMVVDHGLRAEASTEAETALQQAEELGFKSILLQAAWPNGRPEKGHIMEKARQTRYGLLESKCAELDIPCLMTAHHAGICFVRLDSQHDGGFVRADDQAESGLIRLMRASGIDGLQGTLPSRPFLNTSLGKSSGRTVRPLLGMHKDELIALCHLRGLPFAADPTNSDTFFARNHLRKLMSQQHATAAGMLQQLGSRHLSEAGATELPCEGRAACARQPDDSLGQSASAGAPRAVETGKDTSSRALTSDILRVMAACSAASQKLQRDAGLALEQAHLPGPPTLLNIERLRESSKHVGVRALARALAGVAHPCADAQAVCRMPRKAALKLWKALQPGRQPRALSRGVSIECHVLGAPHPRVYATIVRWPAAGSAAEQPGAIRQALLLRPQLK